jgi:hypothetical protein
MNLMRLINCLVSNLPNNALILNIIILITTLDNYTPDTNDINNVKISLQNAVVNKNNLGFVVYCTQAASNNQATADIY